MVLASLCDVKRHRLKRLWKLGLQRPQIILGIKSTKTAETSSIAGISSCRTHRPTAYDLSPAPVPVLTLNNGMTATDKFKYGNLAYDGTPRLWRVQYPGAMAKLDPESGDIVAGDGGGHGLNGGFDDEQDFTQAVVCHWNWHCHRFPEIGGPFLSAFTSYEHAESWALKIRERLLQQGWTSYQTHLSWEEKQAKKDDWPGVIYEIDLGIGSHAHKPVIFESAKLQAWLNVEQGEGRYQHAANEVLILHRIPAASIVRSYTLPQAVEVHKAYYGRHHLLHRFTPSFIGFARKDKPPPVISCSHC